MAARCKLGQVERKNKARQEKNYRGKVWVGGGKVDRGASEVWKLLLKEGASLSLPRNLPDTRGERL